MNLPCPVPRCDQVMPGHLRVCQACRARLLQDLDDVPSLAEHLDLTLSRQGRLGGRSGSRPTETELPWDQRARESAYVLGSTLMGWYRALAAGRPLVQGPVCPSTCDHSSCEIADLGRRPPGTPAGLARWLLHHRRRLLGGAAAADAVDELTAAVGMARRAIDRPPPGFWYAGECGADSCRARLYARHGAATLYCRRCGAIHHVGAREARIVEQAENVLGTAAQIARALNGFTPDLTPSTIRGHTHRLNLFPYGTDRLGRPLYRVGDVLRLIAGEAPKPLSGPACPECSHATCRRIRRSAPPGEKGAAGDIGLCAAEPAATSASD